MSPFNTSPLVRTYTLDEFWRLPDPGDRSKLELIAGVLYTTPPPESAHDKLVTRLNRILTGYLISSGSKGNIYVPRAAIWTNARTYLEPDLFYISASLEKRLDPERRATADLVIEVVSPGSAIYDRNTKADTYGALNVNELWLVDEALAQVEVRNQTGSGFGDPRILGEQDIIVSKVLPGLRLGVKKLYEDEIL